MELYPQYTRITNFNKLVDRFITVQSRNSSSKDKGMIFGLIEILNPWSQNAQIGQHIINTLSREYYRQTNTNELLKFENALKKVNEKLVQITQNGETDWIGKTNAVLILFNKNQVHLSYTGKIRGYLMRDDEFMPIINPKEIYTYQHPLKTFSSVISGDIKLSDRLFFSTTLIFDYLSEANLKSILKEENFLSVPTQISSILKSRNSRNANSLCISMAVSEQNFNDVPEVLYLDEQKFSFYWGNFKSFFQKFSQHSKNTYIWTQQQLSKTRKYYKENIAPKTSKMLKNTATFSKEKLKYSQNKISQTFKKLPKKKINEIKKTNENSTFNVKHYYSSKEKINSFLKLTSSYFKKTIHWLSNFFHNAFLPKNRSKSYIVIALILLVVFIANIGYLQKINQSKETSAQIDESLTALEIQKDDAALSVITGDNEKAVTILDEISAKLQTYQNNKDFEDRIANLNNDIQKLYDKIAGVNRLIDGTEIANFSDKALTFYLFGNIAKSLTGSKEIFQAVIDPISSPEEICRIPNDGGNIVYSTYKDDNIYIYTSSKNIYKLVDKSLTPITNLSGSWPEAIALKFYVDNIYLLNTSAGQIYKFTPEDDQYSDAQNYISNSSSDIKKAIDFSIDGYVYVLLSEGKVAKFSQGSEIDFNLTNIPGSPTLSKPKKITTDENLNSIYILDDNRILEFDKEGKYINQYNFDKNLDNITDFQIYPKTKELYIINSGKIYKYGI